MRTTEMGTAERRPVARRTTEIGPAERKPAGARAPERIARENRELKMICRQQMRWQEQQKRARKHMFLFTVLTWCVLLLNILILFSMHLKIKSMDVLLNGSAGQLNMTGWDSADEKLPDQGITDSVKEAAVQSQTGESYPDIWGLEQVDRPAERTYEQVLERLEELAVGSDLIEVIYGDSYLYPDKLLEALANNPEMAGFVAGYPDAEKKASGGLTEEEKAQAFPLFLQWDPRWGYAEYGDDSCIGLAVCGPTCLSMVLWYLTGDKTLTPDKIAAYSMKNGYYISGTGTAWALLSDVPGMYGVKVGQPEASEREMQKALDDGKMIICSMGPGDFTAAGHFVVIYGYDKEGFLVNDPNCVARSRQRWTYEEIGSQIKHVWTFG